VLSLCCLVRGPGCAVPGSVLAGIMVVLALCVPAEPTVIPVKRSIASGCMCARCVLAEIMVVCV